MAPAPRTTWQVRELKDWRLAILHIDEANLARLQELDDTRHDVHHDQFEINDNLEVIGK